MIRRSRTGGEARVRALGLWGLSAVAFALAAGPAQAGTVESRLVWVEGKPQVEVAVAGLPAAEGELLVPLRLFDPLGNPLWQTEVKVPLAGPAPWTARAALEKITEPAKQHRVELVLRDDARAINYREEIRFAAETAAVQSYGFAQQGTFPKVQAWFTILLNGVKGTELRDAPVALTVRDGDENTVLSRTAALKPAAGPTQHRLEVTPDLSAAVGPFSLEADVEAESYDIFLHHAQRFALAGTLLPLSSFEQQAPRTWYVADGKPQNYRSLQMYYSEHLRDLLPRDYPRLAFDRAQRRSGGQALRIDYQSGKEAYVWSLQELPGRATMLRLWVRGNGSPDQLLVHFEDRVNFALPAWERNAHFSEAVVCALDFEGWREFRVPVLGDGLQTVTFKGSTKEVDGPVRILGLTLRPGKLPAGAVAGEPRAVWIDDLALETQLPAGERLSLEAASNRADGLLADDAALTVTVGNGLGADLVKGRLSLVARDGLGQPLATIARDLPAAAGAFSQAEISLAELAAKRPRGPIVVDVTFLDAARPVARVTRQVVFQRAAQGGLLHDFEEPATYSGFQPGKVLPPAARRVAGGADGQGHALLLPVGPAVEQNSVLFHPALPGVVERVELLVHGGPRPVRLQPWFIDSGYTGVWLRPYNLFWAEPIVVDWQGWKKVEIAAPAAPGHYDDPNRTFLFQPKYPLNLAISATLLEGAEPSEVRFDDLRVSTHLPASEELKLEVAWPDETRLHPPGAPLRVALTNLGPSPIEKRISFALRNYQGFVAAQGELPVAAAAGERSRAVLVESLSPGIYALEWGLAGEPPRPQTILCLKPEDYFGPEPARRLANPIELRRTLGLTTERTYLDFDNTEPAPHMHHFGWFYTELKKLRDQAKTQEALLPFVAASEAAQKKATEAEAAVKTAQQQVAAAQQAERGPREKLVASERQQTAAAAAVQAALPGVEAAQTKLTAAQKAADDAEAARKKSQDAADAAQLAAQAAEKVRVDAQTALAAAEKALVEAQAKAKPAADARPALQKAADDAAAAAKLAAQAAQDDAGNETKAQAAKDAQLAADTALKKLEEARRVAEEAAKAVLAATQARDLAKTSLQTATEKKTAADADAKRAADAALAARKTAEDALKLVKPAQDELARLKAALDGLQKKETDAAAQVKSDAAALAEKVAATAAAEKQLAADSVAHQAARDALAAANAALEKGLDEHGFRVLPVVGFSAEWAGPEARDALAKARYMRWIPNMIQTPRNVTDWSLFVRTLLREYKDRFDTWVFWENPDLDESPQGIPPEKYGPMLTAFHRWVKLYNPQAKVVAGGFNFGKALGYLERIPEPHRLPFDEIAVQMNLGELSPEQADMEGFLDELNRLLRVAETGRKVRVTELDWGVSSYCSPLEQAAYHARAALILASRGAGRHQFQLVNTGFEFEGYGVFHRLPYGNTAELQSHLPHYLPKPAYFALIETERFLEECQFAASVRLPDRGLDQSRAFVYRRADGRLAAAVWRAVDGVRKYVLPSAWTGVAARDAFGFPVALAKGLPCSPLPLLLTFPAGYAETQLVHDLRTLAAADGTHGVLLDLHLAEPDSVARAEYQAQGAARQVVRAGAIPLDRKLRAVCLEGLESETFAFEQPAAGSALLRRVWHFSAPGQKLAVRLNGGGEQTWDLSEGQGNEPGLRENTFVLRGVKAGKNVVAVRHLSPGNTAAWRIEPLPGNRLPLSRWGALNARQTKGETLKLQSAVGTPLAIRDRTFAEGLGAHAVSFIEYPLDRQFSRFEVTVGVDASTEGRGSVQFRLFVDGKEAANSGLMTGFHPAKTLKIENLAGARRLILSVLDAGDGNRHDLANWVDGYLDLAPEPASSPEGPK